jgi:hypothetical protein
MTTAIVMSMGPGVDIMRMGEGEMDLIVPTLRRGNAAWLASVSRQITRRRSVAGYIPTLERRNDQIGLSGQLT